MYYSYWNFDKSLLLFHFVNFISCIISVKLFLSTIIIKTLIFILLAVTFCSKHDIRVKICDSTDKYKHLSLKTSRSHDKSSQNEFKLFLFFCFCLFVCLFLVFVSSEYLWSMSHSVRNLCPLFEHFCSPSSLMTLPCVFTPCLCYWFPSEPVVPDRSLWRFLLLWNPRIGRSTHSTETSQTGSISYWGRECSHFTRKGLCKEEGGGYSFKHDIKP